ncbi:hypothetical protein PQX77_017446 [Marasmius sp. AFHP31]|nr:hypothetical protein PQX77_017446 [Marasmius sp. AFHP31]
MVLGDVISIPIFCHSPTQDICSTHVPYNDSLNKHTTGVKNIRIAGRIELLNGDKVVMGSYVIVRLASPDSTARRLSVANIV